MNRIFLRFVVLVVLAIALATCVIYFTFSSLFGDPLDQIARRQAAGQIFLLEQYVDRAPPDEWLARLNKVREISRTSLELMPLSAALAALPERRRDALLHGAIVIDAGAKSFYRRVDLKGTRYIDSDADVLRAQGLPIDIGQALGMEAIRFVIVALCLLVPMGWWSRAHWRDLQALSRVADEFGRGRLAARAGVKTTSGIAPLAARMNDMAGRIEQLLEARKNLLHSVSHELRTPIARLEFALELLYKEAANPALEPRVAAMRGDLEELDALVNEFLSLTQLNHGQALRKEPFDCAALLRECALGLASNGKRVESLAEDGVEFGWIRGDRRLLARAINNVLGNAVKYAGARVAWSGAGHDGCVAIVIEDDGPGIPVEDYARVFEPFRRLAREQDHAVGGYGLGLAIAHKALELHGGTISIGRSAMGGARFTLTLPRQ